MKSFRYLSPRSLDEASRLLERGGEGVVIISGGTDLLPRIRSGVVAPEAVVDLRYLPLKDIVQTGDYLCLGACVTHRQLRESGLVTRHLPALAQACTQMAGPPVRNRGTLGGNLVTASPAADTAPPLLAYDAALFLFQTGYQRSVPLEQFFTGPGKTVLREGEILTGVLVPLPPVRTCCQFIKMGNRRAMAISVVSVAARLTLAESGEIASARIALGSVAPTPMRAYEAEKRLTGRVVSEELAAEVGRVASQECSPISDIRASADYRRRMVGVLVRRALEVAWRTLVGEDGHD